MVCYDEVAESARGGVRTQKGGKDARCDRVGRQPVEVTIKVVFAGPQLVVDADGVLVRMRVLCGQVLDRTDIGNAVGRGDPLVDAGTWWASEPG